jgi:hypothetical protein
MRKTMTALTVLLGLAFGCGDDSDVADSDADGGENTTAGRGATGMERSGVEGTGTRDAGTTTGSGGSSEPSEDSGMGPAPGADSGADPGNTDPGSNIPTDGNQISFCNDNQDCNDGLNCYTAGHFCSQPCSQDTDCATLGAEYTCAAAAPGFGPGAGFPGGGGFQGGGFPGGGFGDAGTTTPTGTCRITCDGADDTSCPSGLSCLDLAEPSGGNPFGGFPGGGFGGFPGGGGGGAGAPTDTFRCGYPEPPPGQADPDAGTSSGSTPAFGECQANGDCADGFVCTAFGGSPGYCAQSCMADTDCTDTPTSGTAAPSCGLGVMCTLDCSADETCPDGMTCTTIMFGGGMFGGPGGPGGMGPAFCNY